MCKYPISFAIDFPLTKENKQQMRMVIIWKWTRWSIPGPTCREQIPYRSTKISSRYK